MLEGEGAADTEFPFGANVASQVIFDMDGDRTLGAVETLVPLDSREQTDADLSPPGPTRPGSGRIVGDAVEVHVPDAEPHFLVNGDQGRLLIELAERGPGTQWIRLSDRCHALVDVGHLAGFGISSS